jgi:uncharacterized cupin superfamily protein
MQPQPLVFDGSRLAYRPAPIRPEWIRGGNPVAENQVVAVSGDRSVMSIFWRCSAGSFEWIYDDEETIYVIDGGMRLTYPNGEVREVGKGDVVYFPAGTRAHWEIASHVEKVAVFRRPTPKLFDLPIRIVNKLSCLLSRGAAGGVRAPVGEPAPATA